MNMTVDLSRLDSDLESIAVDQVAVARGLLVAREWAGQELVAIDAALDSLSDGVPAATATAARASEASFGLDGLFDDDSLDMGGESLSSGNQLATSGDIASDLAAALEGDDDELSGSSDDSDDLLDFDDLDILEDELLVVD